MILIIFNSQTLINDIFNNKSLYGNSKPSSFANKQMMKTPEITKYINI